MQEGIKMQNYTLLVITKVKMFSLYKIFELQYNCEWSLQRKKKEDASLILFLSKYLRVKKKLNT